MCVLVIMSQVIVGIRSYSAKPSVHRSRLDYRE